MTVCMNCGDEDCTLITPEIPLCDVCIDFFASWDGGTYFVCDCPKCQIEAKKFQKAVHSYMKVAKLNNLGRMC